MKEEYYFSFDEPILENKNIICSFYISNIERKKCFFFITDEKEKLIINYAMIGNSDIMNSIRKYRNSIDLDKELRFEDIFKLPDFIKKYNDKYLQSKVLEEQLFIKNAIDKMSKDNIHTANNGILGLDGFYVELKLKKKDKSFYSSCNADDKKYFYVIDFINSILDELKVNKDYRIKKIM